MAQITLNSTGVASNGSLVLQSNGTTTAVTIDTSQRAAFVAGTAALPAITTTGDTNTGIFFPAADTIAFSEGGAEAMRITSAGDVGIGTSSPSFSLDIRRTDNAAIRLSRSGTAGQISALVFEDGTSTLGTGNTIRLSSSSGAFIVDTGGTSGDTAGGSERMRITSAGNVGIGTSSPSALLDVAASGGATIEITNSATSSTTNDLVGALDFISADNSSSQGGLPRGYVRTYIAESLGTGGYMTFGTAATGSSGIAERMRIDSSGNLGLGVTPSAWGAGSKALQINSNLSLWSASATNNYVYANAYYDGTNDKYVSTAEAARIRFAGATTIFNYAASGSANANITWQESFRTDSSGNWLVGKTATTFGTAGAYISSLGQGVFTVSNDQVLALNRITNDGKLIGFHQDGTEEGTISVSGTTVSYNGGHLSRWAQTTAPKDESIVKGTVLSNLDEMNVYTDAEGNSVANEQLNKVKVSDVEGDSNVAGVFVNWTHDDPHDVDEINMAMTGDMIIRIAQGTTVARGDLLMSAGNGTAKPQGDDIVRSKTVAKVTSTHVTCTYPDGSFCIPCVLMAC